MNPVEVTARTVEEAIEIGLKQLGVERNEVEIEVVSKGKAGILGFGSEPCRVRVSLLTDQPKLITVAKEVADELISRMNLDLITYARSLPSDSTEAPNLDIEGDDSGLLIGRRGETLRTFQFMMNYILSHRVGDRVLVTVDVEQYRERRAQTIIERAKGLAERVSNSGRAMSLEPMSPAERRIVHMALASNPRVVTQSSGEGDQRRLTIHPNRS